MKNHLISLCTVCMNRTAHLKASLMRNIEDNIDYPQLEFVLLNYGSQDDMDEWVQDEMGAYLRSGLLQYYKADFPTVFKMSHSKNMAFKLAKGDILCSIDADNFTGKGYAAYVNAAFAKDGNIFLSPPWIGANRKWWDVQGRLSLWREDFYRFRGYDEAIVDYGYEDQDLKYRLMDAGRRKALLRTQRFLEAIQHGDELRVSGGAGTKLLSGLFMRARSEQEWDLLYLRTDGLFEQFRVAARGMGLDERGLPVCQEGVLVLLQFGQYAPGTYCWNDGGLTLCYASGGLLPLVSHGGRDVVWSPDGRPYYRLAPGRLQDQLLLGRGCYLGKQQLLRNKGGALINETGFGRGEVVQRSSGRQIML